MVKTKLLFEAGDKIYDEGKTASEVWIDPQPEYTKTGIIDQYGRPVCRKRLPFGIVGKCPQ